MSKLNNIIDLVSVLSVDPAELKAFQDDPQTILKKYGLTKKISNEEIKEILSSKSLKRHAQELEKYAATVAKSITVIECPNAGT